MVLTVGLCGRRLVPCRRAGFGRVFPRCCRAGPSVIRGVVGRSTAKRDKTIKHSTKVQIQLQFI